MRNGMRKMIRNKLRLHCAQLFSLFLLLSISHSLIFLISCDDATDYISHRYTCRFVFDETQHPTSLLFGALKSPGTYVTVTTTGDGRATLRHVYVTINDGRTPTEDNVIRTDRENNMAYQLGARNDIGLIVGCTNFNGPTAYDRACPNCADLQPLNFSGNRQQVACGKCSRTYDLETGASASGGDPLMRYIANYNGQRLAVSN